MSIEDRLHKLEKVMNSIIIGGPLLAVFVVVFLGFTWIEIPKQVKDAFNNQAIKLAEEEAWQSAEHAKNSALDTENYKQSSIQASERARLLVEEIESYKNALGGPFYAEQGSIVMKASGTRRLTDTSKCPESEDSFRGTINGSQKFDKTFKLPPKVLLAWSDATIVGSVRTTLKLREVTEKDFKYDFATYCDTAVYGAVMNWLAVGELEND